VYFQKFDIFRGKKNLNFAAPFRILHSAENCGPCLYIDNLPSALFSVQTNVGQASEPLKYTKVRHCKNCKLLLYCISQIYTIQKKWTAKK